MNEIGYMVTVIYNNLNDSFYVVAKNKTDVLNSLSQRYNCSFKCQIKAVSTIK